VTGDERETDGRGARDGTDEGDAGGSHDIDESDADVDVDAGDLDAVATAVHERLAATAELPVDPAASTRLGEAAAVARDLDRGPPAEAAVTRARLGLVADLLAEVDGTGSRDADEHVAAARELLSRALDADDAPDSG
jgi:hypothetical protein